MAPGKTLVHPRQPRLPGIRHPHRPYRPADLLGHLVPRSAAPARPARRRHYLQPQQLGMDAATVVRRQRQMHGQLPHHDRRPRQQRLHRRRQPHRRRPRRTVPGLLTDRRHQRLAHRRRRPARPGNHPLRRRRPGVRPQRPIWNTLNDLHRDRRCDLYDGMLGYRHHPAAPR